MSAAAGRAAGKIGQAAAKSRQAAGNVATKANEAGARGSDNPVNKGAKRDPELYVCYNRSDSKATQQRI